MPTQNEKGRIFRALHEREGAFIIPNPWDAGTARLLAQLGFEALATTSAGYAFSAGKPDHGVGRDEMIAHVASIAGAVDLPVSGDLEDGYGDSPEEAARTIRLAAAAGLVGGSIEDGKDSAERPIHELSFAAERVRAAAEAAHGLPFPFTLTARAENYLNGRPDLDDTIRRLQAYQEAGADVLYAPGLRTRAEIAAVVGAVDRPVNVLMGLNGMEVSLAELAEMGVRRVSVGGALARAALGAFLRAAEEMRSLGSFRFAEDAVSSTELNRRFAPEGHED
ncbi:MAG TPA: isocitrate lyase/phosphoenolpyruvate mutase family protein [Terracidiphilus sp.]|nr:isocitrate lyase/phosphoenolpyruvate mutase family protein [Terracidiphilus sp.]